MDSFVRNLPRVETYSDDGKKPGVLMTAALKRNYQMMMLHATVNKTLLFERDFFTTNRSKDRDTMKGMLRAQLERFHWTQTPAKEVGGKDRWGMTGKTSDEGDDGQDDLLIACMMAMYFSERHMQRVVSNNPLVSGDRMLVDGRATGVTHVRPLGQ
jgi:hypothetical protein